jgi:protoporphyrinogen/coproporphyrinogen III oxidase
VPDSTGSDAHVVVVGGGITGLAAAHELLTGPNPPRVTVLERGVALGGKIATSPFAGLPAVDEGADAFLARVPWAAALARQVGLGDRLTSPDAASAAVWWDELHRIPEGLLLGVPTDAVKLARTRLLSWKGKARAATEPFRPRSDVSSDSIGAYVRARFGTEVHERLVDPLVGSIYAADTDRFSLTAVPQLADLAAGPRSVLLGSRPGKRPPAPAGPVFHAPLGGIGELVETTAAAVSDHGGVIRTNAAVAELARTATGWDVHVTGGAAEHADAVILACPAADAARLLDLEPLRRIEYADVALFTVAVPASAWPERLRGMSGYLVPKPKQRFVTAVSFGSQKWAHWRPELHLDDETLLRAALDETSMHLGIPIEPTEIRITRWASAFPQYRPHHHRLVDEAERQLDPTVALAGASYHGIGIPACVRSAQRAASLTSAALERTRN